MYSTRVTDKTLDDFAVRNGWRPQSYSLAEVEEFCAYINSIVDMDANSVNRYFSWKPGKTPSDKRVEFIKRRVKNEQFMCFASAEYFVTRYGKIRSADEQIISFEFRDAQKIFASVLAEFDDLQVAIQLFCLKCRQLGVSTVVALYFLHRILFRPNTHAVMASVQAQQSDKLAKMIETTSTRLPFWLPPAKTGLKEKEPMWANGSALSVQSGNQEVGIAQGSTPTCVHISELGDYKTPKRTLEEGLFPACHPTASLFMVLEGTGSTASNWQKEKWDFYSANWGNGGRFRPIFIPPACAKDLYPHPDWLRGNAIPEGWSPIEETRRMKRRAELYIRSTDYLARVMGNTWEMGREYMWFWETRWREAVSSHSEKTFLSQYACTPDEAFQSKFDPVFSDETIQVVTKHREQSYKAYAITGRTILMGSDNEPYMPPTEEIDWDEPRIPLHWEANDGNTYDWELIPLLPFDDSDDTRCFDKLLVFQAPEDGEEYAQGIDTADGLGLPNEDRSTTSIHIVRGGNDRDEQVASFTSLRVNSAQMSRIAAAMAILFTTDGNGEVTSSNSMGMKFITEQVRKTGDECQLQLKIMGFYDHHLMHFYDDKGNIDPSKGNKEGWRTSKWSRPLLLTRFVEAVNSGFLKVNCPILIRQLKTFVRKEKNGISEMGHESGQHDDNVFAAAMAWITSHDLENQAARLEAKYKPVEVRQAEADNNWASNEVVIS